MGNYMACMCWRKKLLKKKKKKKKKSTEEMSMSHGMMRRRTTASLEDELIQQQAIAMALHQQHKAQLRFERSLSHRDLAASTRRSYSSVGKPGTSSGRLEEYTRSASTRPRHSNDVLLDPQQLNLNNGIKEGFSVANLETKHFVLVHGGGFGAWCWFKSIALLEESGFVATAVDLTGSGIEPTDPNQITSLAQYVKPLVQVLEKLAGTEKVFQVSEVAEYGSQIPITAPFQVILVGHNIGGGCISYAMECFPNRIAKAIFVAASMVCNGQRAFDVFAMEEKSADDLMSKAQKFIYRNGNSSPPTAVELDKSLVRDLFFNASPAKDVALATVSMRPIPFAPAMEKIVLTPENYGRVRRFFIETTDDQALSPAAQCNIINQNPPEQVFTLKGCDHSPFFSKPQSLHKIFLEIAQLEGKE